MLFGGGMGRRGPSGPRKTEDSVLPLKVTIEDLYKGKTVDIAVSRSIYERSATGNIADRAGNRYSKKTEKQVLTVDIERGMKKGQRITFAGKGDSMPNQLPGDVVFVIDELPHELFQRRGSDLIMKKEITLYEALVGVKFLLSHLDGHQVLVSSSPGAVIAHEAVMEVVDEGMPVYGTPHVTGVLYVQFEVKFPERLDITDAMKKILRGVLPGPTEPPPVADASVKTRELTPPDMETRKMRESLGKQAYDSDVEVRVAEVAAAIYARCSDSDSILCTPPPPSVHSPILLHLQGGAGGGAQRVQCAQS